MNTLQLKYFYESSKDEYYRRRHSGDINQWDEAYKWDIFPKLNDMLKNHMVITPENLPEIIAIIKQYNPQQGSFAHWIEIDNLQILKNHKNGHDVLKDIWNATPNTIDATINETDFTSNFLIHHKFGNAIYGYLLAARDCNNFAIYHSNIVKHLVETGVDMKPKTKGGDYKLVNDAALYLGELMQADGLTADLHHRALNGQDFMWVVWQIAA